MSVTRVVRSSVALAAIGLLFTVSANASHADSTDPQITVAPSSGLADGDMVQVSGTGFQQQDIKVIECGGGDVNAHPAVGKVCTTYSVTVSSDAAGNFGPVAFRVASEIDGSQYTDGHHKVPATYDCTVANDCLIRAYALTRANWSAEQQITFGS
jgi:hypothetical protein